MSTNPADTLSPKGDALSKRRAAELLDIMVETHKEYLNGLYVQRIEGATTFEDLRQRIKLFMVFSRRFPQWLANVHARCPEPEVRQRLVRNMYDEEVFDKDLGNYHVGQQIAEAKLMGLTDADLERPEDVTPTMFACVNAWDNITRNRTWQEGLAALACLELTNTKEFRDRIGMPSSGSVAKAINIPGVGVSGLHHETKDEQHGASELEDICAWIDNDALWRDVKKTVRESSALFALFLHGLYRKIRLGEKF